MSGRRISDTSTGPAAKKAKLGNNKHESPDQFPSLAKWCSVDEDGTLNLDGEKVKSFLSQSEQEDARYMQEMVQGKVLDAKLYPLVFDAVLPDDAPDVVKLRSLPYFTKLVADAGNNGTLYHSLTHTRKRFVAVGLRDLYIAGSTGLLGEQDKHIQKEMIDIFDECIDSIHMSGMSISFHPSKDFRMLKFVEDLDEKVGNDKSALFAQIMDTPRLFAAFVNPKDLSYHNFENIIHLDKWFETSTTKQQVQELSLSLEDLSQTTMGREVYTCRLRGNTPPLLKDLATLDLYVPPLNSNTRGGERFIFHSSLLSKALTKAIESSGLLEKLANGQLHSTFEFVNYVFRCNKFAPGDSNFETHLDTPYYDSSRSQVSKYTLIIYLNEGCGDPVLRLKDVHIKEVEDMTCVIFDQRYEHEGRPFLDGIKTFIRTELIFKDDDLQHDDRISALFNEACYMSGQSMFDKSLAAHAHECFERANSLHWAIEKAATQPPVYLHKQFQGINFLTNGHHYWFQKTGAADAKSCALVACIDYFNCKVGQNSFQSLVKSSKVQRGFTNTADIWLFLSSHTPESKRGLKKLLDSDVESLIKKSSDKPFVGCLEDWDENDSLPEFDEDGDGCCPTHSHPMFNAWKNNDVMRCYEVGCRYTRQALFGAPLLILNEEIVINDDNIIVTGDRIFILQKRDGRALPPINFAACWSDLMPREFVEVGEEIPAPQLLLPPMTFHESPAGFQLSLDFFRNDWMVKVDDSYSIPVPDVVERPEGDMDFGIRVPELDDEMDTIFE